MRLASIFYGRVQVVYSWGRYGWTRGGGKTWHGGIDLVGLDDKTIRMPYYKGKKINGKVVRARIVLDRSNKTWEWGYYVCVQLDADQTPDAVNFLYFCHCSSLLVQVGQKVSSGDALAVMGRTGNAALGDCPYDHCHLEVRATATGKGLDPTAYAGCDNAVGIYGTAEDAAPAETGEVIIDVSYHQDVIDWAKVPYRAMVRIGYRGYGTGKLMKDEQFDANLAGAKAHDKLLGFYFFSQAITEDEARAEADFCASVAPTGYPLFFDVEWSHSVHDGRADSLTKAQRTACARAFCKRAAALGFQPGVYTFTSFATAKLDYEGLCKDYIGWLADTRANYDKTLPRHIHQYGQTAKGGVQGIGPETDLNRIVKALPTLDKADEAPANGEEAATPALQNITVGPVSGGDAAAVIAVCNKHSAAADSYTNAENHLQVICIRSVVQSVADAVLAVCKERGLTDAKLYMSYWT